MIGETCNNASRHAVTTAERLPARRRGRPAWSPPCALALLAALVQLPGCAGTPLPADGLATPPMVLAPAAEAAVTDQRSRYREILCALLREEDPERGEARCAGALHRLALEGPPSGAPVVLGPPRLALRLGIVPGYGADCFADIVTVLGDTRERLARRGWPSESLPIEGLSSSTRNAELLREHILAAPLAPGERFVLLGYSKGAADMLEALARHPEIRPRVAAAVSLAGTVMGSPLADDPPRLLPFLARQAGGGACAAGDDGAFESLRRTTRADFLARFPPSSYGVPLFSVGAFAAPERTSRVLAPMQRRLAAMDPRNDSQTLWTDQVIPGSVLLGYLDADHWAVALPIARRHPVLAALFTDENDFPRGPMVEAVMRLVEERLLDGERQRNVTMSLARRRAGR